jgi:hypothetical protein
VRAIPERSRPAFIPPEEQANLREAEPRLANRLRGAILKDAIAVTAEVLEKQAKSLKGATMPDGSIHP